MEGNFMWYFLIALAFIVVIALAYYAGQLLWQLKAQQQNQESEKQKRIDYIVDSVSHIAKAMKAEQCEFSEGVLRIWVLLEHYCSDQSEPKDYQHLYPGFYALYEVIKDMPTHEARKKVNKKELFKLDSKRWKAEKDHQEQINADLDKLLAEFS